MTVTNKRNDFKFLIVNFPFTCSNTPATPVYGVYISQLTRYSRIILRVIDNEAATEPRVPSGKVDIINRNPTGATNGTGTVYPSGQS